jgi:hypothetical protein
MRLDDSVFQLINGDFSTPQEAGNLEDEDEEHCWDYVTHGTSHYPHGGRTV